MKPLHAILLQNKMLKSQLIEFRGLEKMTRNVPKQLQETASYWFVLGQKNILSSIFAHLIAEIDAVAFSSQNI